MYQPQKYKNDGSSFIRQYIASYPFATLICNSDPLLATHIPILIDTDSLEFRLFAHIANHNPMRRYLVDGMPMLAIFKGPDAYVSSSWYTEPDVPTWDYTAVHVNARLKVQTDNELQKSLEKLITHFEREQENPITAASIPTEMWHQNFKEITGFWLEPFKIVGIEKLHQGFPHSDLNNITEQLDIKGCPQQQLAALIKKKHNL